MVKSLAWNWNPGSPLTRWATLGKSLYLGASVSSSVKWGNNGICLLSLCHHLRANRCQALSTAVGSWQHPFCERLNLGTVFPPKNESSRAPRRPAPQLLLTRRRIRSLAVGEPKLRKQPPSGPTCFQAITVLWFFRGLSVTGWLQLHSLTSQPALYL